MVEAIIARKMADKELRATEVREHPDAPGLLLNIQCLICAHVACITNVCGHVRSRYHAVPGVSRR